MTLGRDVRHDFIEKMTLELSLNLKVKKSLIKRQGQKKDTPSHGSSICYRAEI